MKIIKKHWDITLLLGIGAVLIIAGVIGIVGWPKLASGEEITVTATVSEWMTLAASASTTGTLSPDLVDTAGVTHIGSSTPLTLTMGTNSSDGYSVTASSSNAGLKATTTISTGIATTTLSAGVNGYGIQATSTVSNLVQAVYNWATSTQNVGAATSSTKMLSKSTTASADVVWMTVKAACLVTTAVGSYTDKLTFTMVGTP